MSNQADSVALSPWMFGEAFFAVAATMQRRIAGGMLTIFDAVADATSDSLRANAQFAQDIGNAETPVGITAAGFVWFQGRIDKGVSWFRTLAEQLWHTPAPRAAADMPLLPPAGAKRAPMFPLKTLAPKPPAGKLRRAVPILVSKPPKKSARPTAK